MIIEYHSFIFIYQFEAINPLTRIFLRNFVDQHIYSTLTISLYYAILFFNKKISFSTINLSFQNLSSTYSMCSLAVSTQDSPAVEPRSNPGSGKILMSENLRLYTTSPVVMC